MVITYYYIPVGRRIFKGFGHCVEGIADKIVPLASRLSVGFFSPRLSFSFCATLTMLDIPCVCIAARRTQASTKSA